MPENSYTLEDTTPGEKISGEIGGSLKNISTMDTLDEQTKKANRRTDCKFNSNNNKFFEF